MLRDDGYLLDMLVAARAVAQYTQGVTWSHFEQSPLLQDAVMRRVQNIGEAARSISDAFRDSYPSIPWRQIIGMRNRLVHHYFEIRTELVWEVVQQDIPTLIEQLVALLPAEGKDAP